MESNTDIPTFRVTRKLGSGACAEVFLATNDETNEDVAVKVVSNPKYQRAAVHEYDISRHLVHDNIITPSHCFRGNDGSVLLVQEYAPNGDLYLLIEPYSITSAEIERIFKQLVLAVEYLHQNNVVHRDIKPENVLIDASNVARLCDFGMAGYDHLPVNSGCGTIPYAAPEILAAKQGPLIAEKAHDIWSLGVTLFIMVTGQFPWMQATVGDENYEDFLNNDFSMMPWSTLAAPLVELCEACSHLYIHA